MQTKVSSKGQIVLPVAIRNRFLLQAGDALDIQAKGNQIVLTPKKQKKRKGRLITDPSTGVVCVTFGPGAPVITNEMVAKLLEDFP